MEMLPYCDNRNTITLGKYLKVLILMISGLCFVHEINAQDFHLSQTEASPMILNPALTGAFKGDHRLSIHQRNQWASVVNNTFLTSAFSLSLIHI